MNPSFSTWIFRANILFFALLVPILFDFSFADESRFFRLSISTLLLIIMFALPALNSVALFSKFFKQSLDIVEFFSLTLIFSLLLVPLLLTIESDTFHILSRELPIINSLISFALFAFFYQNKEPAQPLRSLFAVDPIFSFWKALFLSFAIISTTVVGIITAYYPLPDLDPYYWVTVFQDQFAKGVISALASYRPLFSSLTYLFNQSAGIDLYAFFKYLIPFFAIAPLIPAILIARRFSGFIPQLVIFLIPLVNASFFLYTTLPIPQSIFNSLLIISLFFALHSLLSHKKVYFYIAGLILLIGFFYHEMSAIPFIAWLIALLVEERDALLNFTQKSKFTTGLIGALIVSNLSLFIPLFSFATSWSIKVVTLITHSEVNFLFPAQYTNIDGNSVGWQGLMGVLQYYAFYFGPLALLILLLFPFILRNSLIRALLKKQEVIFLILSLCVFFIMSDILPRLFNVALLPERALGFVSLFLLAFIPLLFMTIYGTTTPSWYRYIPHCLLIALFINLGGALYINNLKKYLITPAQLASAEWIRVNLPKKHVIFSSDNQRLLTFFAKATIAENSDSQLYYDKNTLEQHLDKYMPKSTADSNAIRTKLKNISDSLADLANKQALFDKGFILSAKNESNQLNRVITSLEEETAILNRDKDIPPKQYIYFSAPSNKNPYTDRPYMKTHRPEEKAFIFDQYPERFRMIYSDIENDIYLWEVL